MPFSEKELKQLCEQLVACEDDEAAIKLAEQLRDALHDHVEEVRGKLNLFRPAA